MNQKYYDKLKERDIVPTTQRVSILESMQTRTDHPDAEAVYTSLRADLPLLSLDTVYRTLNMFSAKGVIKTLALPTHRFRFEGGLHEHDHFLCTQCKVIIDVECSELPHSPPPAVNALGKVLGQEKVYTGICHSCAVGETLKG